MAKKFKRVPADVPVSELTPLNISCGSTKCEDNLHCFNTGKRAAKKYGMNGVCKECGAVLVDWDRVYKNDIHDSKFIFDSMKQELIRHVYWHTKIDSQAIEKTLKYDKDHLRKHVRSVLRSRIEKKNYRDGWQTPSMGDEIVNYAQHATATCCRKCLEYWHNIDPNHKLTDDQMDFCVDLAMLYIEERVPDLQNKN